MNTSIDISIIISTNVSINKRSSIHIYISIRIGVFRPAGRRTVPQARLFILTKKMEILILCHLFLQSSCKGLCARVVGSMRPSV